MNGVYNKTSIEYICYKKLQEHIVETKPTYKIHTFNIYDDFKIYSKHDSHSKEMHKKRQQWQQWQHG